jgi:hypothetical protein
MIQATFATDKTSSSYRPISALYCGLFAGGTRTGDHPTSVLESSSSSSGPGSASEAVNNEIWSVFFPVFRCSNSCLASAYYQEAFNRASWFIDSKRLTHEFMAADEKGAIQRPTSVKETK